MALELVVTVVVGGSGDVCVCVLGGGCTCVCVRVRGRGGGGGRRGDVWEEHAHPCLRRGRGGCGVAGGGGQRRLRLRRRRRAVGLWLHAGQPACSAHTAVPSMVSRGRGRGRAAKATTRPLEDDLEAAASDAGEAGTRRRYNGTAQDFAKAIEPLVAEKGRVFLVYDEAPKVCNTKIDQTLLKHASAYLHILWGLQRNHSFCRTLVESAMTMVIEKYAEPWGMKNEAHQKDWIETMTRRTMNACRAIQQVALKPKVPSWALSLPWMLPPPAPLGGSSSAAAASPASPTTLGDPPTTDYYYGWSDELHKPWRQRTDTKNPKKEIGCVVLPADPKPDDPIISAWSDGHRKNNTSITVAAYEKLVGKSPKVRAAAKVHFEGEHCETHHRVVVKRRKDGPNPLLMSMYEQTAHIMCVKVCLFADEASAEKETEDAERKAASFMTRLARDYCDGKYTKEERYAYRDAELQKIFAPRPTAGVKKRPSVALGAAARRLREKTADDVGGARGSVVLVGNSATHRKPAAPQADLEAETPQDDLAWYALSAPPIEDDWQAQIEEFTSRGYSAAA